MVWVENELSKDFEKEEAARTAMTNFVGDGNIPDISDPNLILRMLVSFSTMQIWEKAQI